MGDAMIPATALAYLKALEDAMPLKPRVKVKARGIPLEENYTERDGKIVKRDTAPPHVRAGRRRKRDKVTGARAVK